MKNSKNICKRIFTNPFFIALLLTVFAIIIVVAMYKVQNYGGGSVVKCFFYMFICFSILLFVNNLLIKKSLNTDVIHAKKEVKDVFSGIDISKQMSHDVIQITPNIYNEEESYADKYIKKIHHSNDKMTNNEENLNHNNSNDEKPNNKDSNNTYLGGNNDNLNNENLNNENLGDNNLNNDNLGGNNEESNNENLGGNNENLNNENLNDILNSIVNVQPTTI